MPITQGISPNNSNNDNNPFPRMRLPYQAIRSCTTFPFVSSSTQMNLTAGKIYLTPMYNQNYDSEYPWHTIAIYVVTGATSSQARLGIYAMDSGGYPGDLILNAGLVSTANGGAKGLSIDQTLEYEHWYYLALLPSANITVTALVSTVGFAGNYMYNYVGNRWESIDSIWFSSGLPNSLQNEIMSVGNSTIPYIFMRN